VLPVLRAIPRKVFGLERVTLVTASQELAALIRFLEPFDVWKGED